MAIIRQCDRCGTIDDVSAMISITRKRQCCNQHDREYATEITADYDLCQTCARKIELLFISEEKADKTIMT